MSRRTFLAWTAAGAAGLAVLTACSNGDPSPAAHSGHHRVDLHLSLTGSAIPAGSRALVGVKEHAVVPHTAASRAAFLHAHRGLGIDPAALTHVVHDVALPVNGPTQMTVIGPTAANGNRPVYASKILLPGAAAHEVRGLVVAAGANRRVARTDRRFAALGIPASSATSPSQDDWAALDTVSGDTDTAAALVFKHPLIVSLNGQAATITLGLIYSLTTLPALAAQIAALRAKGGYRTDVPVVIAGQPGQFPPAGYKPQPPLNGQPPPVVPPTTQPKVAQLDPSLTPLMGACVKEAVARIRSSSMLVGVLDPHDDSRVADPLAIGTPLAPRSVKSGGPPQPGLSGQCVDASEHGVRIVLSSDQPGGARGDAMSAALKVTNNYARFLTVHVQYFDASGAQVYADPRNAADTGLSELVCCVMPVLTEAGVPIPGSSTREFTVTLPEGAASARLLVIGLGNSRFDSPDWSSYFVKADGSRPYDQLISPPEALLPVMLTSVVNFGFTAALLVMDSIIANGYRELVDGLESTEGDADEADEVLSTWVEEAEEIIERIEKVEGVASPLGRFMSLLLGVLDYATEAAAEGTTDPTFLESAWGLVKAMGIAFSEFIGLTFLHKIVDLLVEAGAEKASEALPIVGEIFAVAAALIDAANLAEAAYDTGTATWVMATELAFTYDMTVTVDHDPKSGTLPPQAKTFRLTTQVAAKPAAGGSAGAAAGRVIAVDGNVADFTVDGSLVVVVPNVPYGGVLSVGVAMWSGATPATGWQAAGGTSPWYPNDGDEPPSPEFPIVQNLVPISASSKLAIYNTTAYTSDPTIYDPFVFTTVPAPTTWTAAQLAAQAAPYPTQIGSVTFSSPSNAIAYTYLTRTVDGPRWFLRSYALFPPLSPDIATVPSVRWAGPYPTRPWVLYDPLEQDPAAGQHFILEPANPGYHVRKVSLVGSLINSQGDPFTIDETSSWGRFLVDLDDVAIYHQGFIVGVNATTSTLAVLRLPVAPSSTVTAQKAKGFAGPALQAGAPPGVLDAPSHVAVTMDGTILVLESGADRLQAFNLSGSPVARFAPTSQYPSGSPYAPLIDSDRTYLALSVDGGGAIYVLSTPRSGTARPTDYRLDVYATNGSHVYTSAGINVADVAVDYFRDVHGVNFAPLMSKELGIPAFLHLGETITFEPSVSSWYTTAPGQTQPPPTPTTPTTSTTVPSRALTPAGANPSTTTTTTLGPPRG